MTPQRFTLTVAAVLAGLCFAGTALSQGLTGADLAAALKKGGHVLVMRHAASPKTLPTAETAAPGNTKLERQLDDAGKSSAAAMGAALRSLKIPVGEVWSSPTFRAMETARLARFATVQAAPELGEGGANMQPPGAGAQNWLKAKSAERPAAGQNRVFITHAPNLNAAFGPQTPGVADGEALVFRPDGTGGAALVGRVKIEEWPKLAGP